MGTGVREGRHKDAGREPAKGKREPAKGKRQPASLRGYWLPLPQDTSTDVDDGLGDGIGGFNGLGVGLEVPLGGDQSHQFFGEIDVGQLQRA